ncbi:E3 ubiquitin-protein ligase NRDP1-like isoform X1 [Dinothrombium tinctorium]|uniref:E3 ubiquitin-protein ligase NRDP1-like isoform X1 n=1 Tax=Dinothrombium tinctorium TaxID=1965070 RepID=A0A443R9X8_9ACAR|nr:E3 ubiquitin-protein ligase NRDP1-like isoform X1 [Dinothrombium tinctorium]
MGFDVERFVDFDADAYNDLLCSICTGVLESPIMTACEHIFCTQCLDLWFGSSTSCHCPFCNAIVNKNELKSIPRIARNFLGNLNIRCNYRKNGCNAIVKLDHLGTHLAQCNFRCPLVTNEPYSRSASPPIPIVPRLASINDSTIDDEERGETGNGDEDRSGQSLNNSLLTCGLNMWKCVKWCGSCFLSIALCFASCMTTLFSHLSHSIRRVWNTPNLGSKITYATIITLFTIKITFGYVFRSDCEYNSALPYLMMIFGSLCNLAAIIHYLKHHVDRFSENKCRIINLLLFIAGLVLITIAAIVYPLFTSNFQWIPERLCIYLFE